MTTLVRLLLGSMLVLTSLFLILLVMVQRGRGGGLAGALGGMGGQSAFGTKAGDLFTRITVGVAAFWIVLCLLATNLLGRQKSLISSELGGAAPQATAPLTPAQSTIPQAPPQTPPQTPAAPPSGPADGGESLSLPATPAAEARPAEAPPTPAPATPAADTAPAAPTEPAPAK
jgi:preprotein translocase subunit SecG